MDAAPRSSPALAAVAGFALRSDFTAVLETRGRDEFTSEVVRFGRKLEFDTVSVTLFVDGPNDRTRFASVDNTPPAYREVFENPANFPGCPVMRHCKSRGTPIVWDQSTYVRLGEGARWEHQARFGYRFGIALALHLPKGRHFFIGVDRDQALPDSEEEVSRLVGLLSLYALCANEAASNILMPLPASASDPSLTPRELEVLRWTLEGKTAWEVGMILAISARTAAIHANNATRKLDCVNKHQAALRALQIGLI